MATKIYNEPWSPLNINCNWKPSKLGRYLLGENFVKETTPLDIVDNVENTQIYKDLHFEVFVKAEAEIKNFVDCFDLSAFQKFPNNESSYWYNNIANSLIFNCHTKNYYSTKYTWENWEVNHNYVVGDKVKYLNYFGWDYLICKVAHTSGEDIFIDLEKWITVGSYNSNPWLNIDKRILESNYNEDAGFPYVGSLVFKNLWGCDMLNYLNTYVNESHLAISYYNFFAEKLREKSYYYNKYFQQGYFLDKNPSDPNNSDGFGVRLIPGESFRSDNLLGDLSQNNYLDYSVFERSHQMTNTSEDDTWVPSHDSINKDYFDGSIDRPFDHWYNFKPYIGMPFFKEKVFEDFSIELVLQREDSLGNVFQRVVNLPILVTFTNNLIKCYFKGSEFENTPYYSSEYLNSNAVNSFYYNHTEGHNGVQSNIVVWCPNVKRLSVSSTIFNPNRVNEFPSLKNMNGNPDSPIEGQTCILHWSANELDVGEVITAIHSIEYSDGENYDKFIYIEEIRRNS